MEPKDQSKKQKKIVSDLQTKKVKYTEIDCKKPLGLVQLINKKNYKEITDYDRNKFEAIQ